MRVSAALAAAAVAAVAYAGGCGGGGVLTLEVSSASFQDGHQIPLVHTCDGDNTSPALSWGGLPDGTASLAVIMDDPDARGWVHWVLFDLPPETRELPEGIVHDSDRPGGGVHGRGNAGVGYFGPCPPKGRGPHRYSFRVYALDSHLGLPAGSSKTEVDAAMRGHIMAMGELVGVYERS
jgi:Raf kinase inhibitor-like YbhB/YbcL family protein